MMIQIPLDSELPKSGENAEKLAAQMPIASQVDGVDISQFERELEKTTFQRVGQEASLAAEEKTVARTSMPQPLQAMVEGGMDEGGGVPDNALLVRSETAAASLGMASKADRVATQQSDAISLTGSNTGEVARMTGDLPKSPQVTPSKTAQITHDSAELLPSRHDGQMRPLNGSSEMPLQGGGDVKGQSAAERNAIHTPALPHKTAPDTALAQAIFGKTHADGQDIGPPINPLSQEGAKAASRDVFYRPSAEVISGRSHEHTVSGVAHGSAVHRLVPQTLGSMRAGPVGGAVEKPSTGDLQEISSLMVKEVSPEARSTSVNMHATELLSGSLVKTSVPIEGKAGGIRIPDLLAELNARVVAQVVSGQSQETELRLSPPELGSVRVAIQLEDGRWHISISAEREEIAEFLRENGSELEEQMQQALPERQGKLDIQQTTEQVEEAVGDLEGRSAPSMAERQLASHATIDLLL